MEFLTPTITRVTLDVSGTNTPIRRQKLSEWSTKQYPTMHCPLGAHINYVDTYVLKVKRWTEIDDTNTN